METERVHELRDQAGQWRTIAERISDTDPKAAEALNDLASRLDRQLSRLGYYRAHDGAVLMPTDRTVGSKKATTVRSARS
jgi:hypothetical protein